MTDFGPPCPPCRFPDDCACDSGRAFQEEMEERRRGSQIRMGASRQPPQIQTHVRVVDEPPVLRREVSCVQGWPKVGARITKAYTNVHGAGAEGTCERGHHHLFSLTEKEYRAVSGALRQPRLL